MTRQPTSVPREGDRRKRPGGRRRGDGDLERLFELSLDLLCVAGLDGFFKRVNPAFERILGHRPDELMSCQFVEFVHPDDRESTLEEIESLSSGAVTVDFENRYRTRDGGYRWLAWRARPVVDRGLIYAVARDITEQRRSRELLSRQAAELARSNTDLERFAYAASHDLRAPLRSIENLSTFIEQDLGESIPDATREHLGELRRRVLAMKALTDDLLTYARAGRDPEEIERVDMAALVDDIAFLIDPPEGFRIEAAGELPVLETARGALEQVLRNLLANAVQHHDRGDGRIAVTARGRRRFWEIAVTDDGPGIPTDEHDRIFRVFGRGESGERSGGTGMGLALVERIVEQQGGRVWLEAGEGRGATFRFTWPRRIESPPAPADPDPVATSVGGDGRA